MIAIVQDEKGQSKATKVKKPTGINNIIKAIEVLSKIQLTSVDNNNEVIKFINEEKIQN